MDKYNELKNFIKNYCDEGIIVAFSGGVDSSLVLKAAQEVCSKVLAVTFETMLSPMKDLDISKGIAEEIGAHHAVLELDEFKNEELLNNPIDRCYICKKYLFENLFAYGKENGYGVVFDGTILDDLNEYRPGLKAIKDLGVISPLKESGFSKSDVRFWAEKLDLSVSNRPSSPCMATRLPYNTKLDRDLLNRISQAEDFLKANGFDLVRVRVYKDIARIEIEKSKFLDFLEVREKIVERLKDLGFTYVCLDIEGFRSGSMDVNLRRDNGL